MFDTGIPDFGISDLAILRFTLDAKPKEITISQNR